MHIIEDAIKVERLALIALQLIDPTQRSDAWLEKSFQEALPKALRLVELTEEFLKRKECLLAHAGRKGEAREGDGRKSRQGTRSECRFLSGRLIEQSADETDERRLSWKKHRKKNLKRSAFRAHMSRNSSAEIARQ